MFFFYKKGSLITFLNWLSTSNISNANKNMQKWSEWTSVLFIASVISPRLQIQCSTIYITPTPSGDSIANTSTATRLPIMKPGLQRKWDQLSTFSAGKHFLRHPASSCITLQQEDKVQHTTDKIASQWLVKKFVIAVASYQHYKLHNTYSILQYLH